MSTATPTWTRVLTDCIDARLSDVHTSIPGRVESYDSSTQRASVQPLLKRGYEDEEGERQVEILPVIQDVPIVFPGSGSYADTFPISKGDIVLLVFMENSIDRWLSVGGLIDPSDDRRFALSDAVAIPGLRHSRLDPTAVSSSARVISAPEIQLGSTAAVDAAVKGTTYRTAEDALFALFAAAFAALGTDSALSGSTKTACLAVAGGMTAFNAAASAYLATRVKVQ